MYNDYYNNIFNHSGFLFPMKSFVKLLFCYLYNTVCYHYSLKSILIEIAKNKFMYLHPCMRLVSLLLCLLWFSNNNGYTNALLVPLNRNSIWRQFKLRPAECQS